MTDEKTRDDEEETTRRGRSGSNGDEERRERSRSRSRERGRAHEEETEGSSGNGGATSSDQFDRKPVQRGDGFKLYIGNINFRTDKYMLRDAFEKFGPVQDVYIPTDRNSGRPRGFAFVTFENEADSEKAIAEMADREFDGRTIRVNKALPKGERSAGARNFDRSGGGGRDYGRGGRGGYDRGGRGGYDRGYDRGGRGGYDRGGRGGYDRGGRDYDRGGRDYDRGGRDYDRGGRDYDRRGRDDNRDGRDSFDKREDRGAPQETEQRN